MRYASLPAVHEFGSGSAKIDKEPQKAFPGQVMFRVAPEVNR